MTRMRVALVTGAVGFLGMFTVKALLEDPRGYHVLALIRGKEDQSAQSRLDELKRTLELDPTAAERLHCVDATIGPDLDIDGLAARLKAILDDLHTKRIDVVIHCAASLKQEHDRMQEERRERIRAQNMSTNVEGTTALLGALGKLASGGPDVVRIVRPSIVMGKESNTGVMAFLSFLERKTCGVRNLTLLKLVGSIAPRIALVGNPECILDVIDVSDVMAAMMAFVKEDDKRDDEIDTSGYTLGAFHYVSTAYVHGTRQGLLLEEIVIGKTDFVGEKQFNNSYEESKALAEEAIRGWFHRLLMTSKQSEQLADRFIVNNVTNAHSTTLLEFNCRMFSSATGWDSKGASKKFIYVRSVPELKEAVRSSWFGRGRIGKLWISFWIRAYVLWPYLLRPSGTRFDTTNTKKCVGASWTIERVHTYGSYHTGLLGPVTSIKSKPPVPTWRKLLCCGSK